METKNKETLEEAYAKLVKAYEKLYEEKSDFKKRIDKAIEYIEKHIKYECDATYGGLKFMSYHLYNFKKEDLLKKLRGEKSD